MAIQLVPLVQHGQLHSPRTETKLCRGLCTGWWPHASQTRLPSGFTWAACRACSFERGATGITEPLSCRIRVLPRWTVPRVSSPCWCGFLHPLPTRWLIAIASHQDHCAGHNRPPRIQVPSGALVLRPIVPEDSMLHSGGLVAGQNRRVDLLLGKGQIAHRTINIAMAEGALRFDQICCSRW